jgi:hypothetical protein
MESLISSALNVGTFPLHSAQLPVDPAEELKKNSGLLQNNFTKVLECNGKSDLRYPKYGVISTAQLPVDLAEQLNTNSVSLQNNFTKDLYCNGKSDLQCAKCGDISTAQFSVDPAEQLNKNSGSLQNDFAANTCVNVAKHCQPALHTRTNRWWSCTP